MHRAVSFVVVLGSCGSTPRNVVAPARPHGPYTVTPLALPGADPTGIFLDYLAFDASTGLVWVPAGPTGSVDVVDSSTHQLKRIDGWKTQEMERNGKKRVVGPSAVTIGKSAVYIGNRGDFTVCAMRADLTRGACGTLDAMPDGIAYVAETDEVWVTTPRDRSLRILDGATLAQKARLPFDGEPEGFAVDAVRHRFYTNLEDKDVTLAIDTKTHATTATWHPNCGEDGPHGLRLAEADGLLFVACSAKAETLDVAHAGAIVGSIDTDDGVDDLDYVAATRTLYVAAAKTGKLTIASVDANGALAVAETVATKVGGRNAVVDAHGTVYVADGPSSELLIVAPSP